MMFEKIPTTREEFLILSINDEVGFHEHDESVECCNEEVAKTIKKASNAWDMIQAECHNANKVQKERQITAYEKASGNLLKSRGY